MIIVGHGYNHTLLYGVGFSYATNSSFYEAVYDKRTGHYTVRLLFQPTEGEAAASYITTVALGDAESIFGVNIDSQIPTGRRTRCFGARLIGSMKSWPPPTGDKDDRN
ncbi:hypothetical protein HS088_TW22G01469 [Tripterygium wilfordii]|uniref:Uncharacterized protein n=1 Tax=Tripterygium wilfordii TaxID=458696 RepID=A0A7J7C0Y8_TRIWF|nr:hypothetical protein HS088_TW22G01469 [Tripterygium wilfordii]